MSIKEEQFMSQTKSNFSQSGQALLEIAITIGIAAIIIAALAITTIISLRNSQFAQNQVQATKLAQAGLETVRSIKNRNLPVCFSDTDQRRWLSSPKVWDHQFGEQADECNNCLFKITPTSTSCQLTSARNNQDLESLQNGKFSRQIIIKGNLTGSKQIISRVYWTDFSGDHSSELITFLADY